MRKQTLINNGIYHVYNRGVDKRTTFTCAKDYVRFISNLLDFNDINPIQPANQRFRIKTPRNTTIEQIQNVLLSKRAKQSLVEVLAFCLMPNHFHLLLRQLKNDGISKFMHKIGMGYTRYFNECYQRSGSLFEGTFKTVAIEHERQLLHLPYYIHMNPLDLKYPSWRKKEITNYKNVMKYLEGYRWSSHLDYAGKEGFPAVTQRKFLLEIFGGETGYKREVKKWLKERERNLKTIAPLTLEQSEIKA